MSRLCKLFGHRWKEVLKRRVQPTHGELFGPSYFVVDHCARCKRAVTYVVEYDGDIEYPVDFDYKGLSTKMTEQLQEGIPLETVLMRHERAFPQ